MKPNIYQLALDAQSACNLSAICNSLANQVLPEVWAEAKKKNKGTGYVNHHPVIFLFLHQMFFLQGYEPFDTKHHEHWMECHRICEEKALVVEQGVPV